MAVRRELPGSCCLFGLTPTMNEIHGVIRRATCSKDAQLSPGATCQAPGICFLYSKNSGDQENKGQLCGSHNYTMSAALLPPQTLDPEASSAEGRVCPSLLCIWVQQQGSAQCLSLSRRK